MYYALSSAYRSMIDKNKFFVTSDEAKAYDADRIKSYFGPETIDDLVGDEYDGPLVNLFKFALEWAAEERAKPKRTTPLQVMPEPIERIREAEEEMNAEVRAARHG